MLTNTFDLRFWKVMQHSIDVVIHYGQSLIAGWVCVLYNWQT